MRTYRQQEKFWGRLGEEEGMEFVHKTIVERRKIFQAVRAGFFQSLEEKYLGARVKLFKQMTQLRHRVTTCRDTEDIVNESFNELLAKILSGNVLLRDFPRCQQFIEWNCLRGKGNRWF